ncbi:MAG: GTP-binding protein [Planctomycetes bacterium]|nr:GTP-binding protein [Planctomycetota bacterium]
MDDISKIRNVGVIAHIDAGKTTTTERILFYSGRIHNLGYVDEGTTTTDWYRLEREMGISIFSAVTTIYWDNYQINIIDTPGHIDFTAEVERSLRVLDGSIIVFCGVAGVQAQSETVWKQADRYKLPRIVYINKLDRNGSDYKRVFHEISTKLNCTLIPITIPLYKENQFVGVIDTIHANCLYFDDKDEGVTISTGQIEPSQLEYFQYWKEILLDNLSKFDDDTLKDVIECREISSDAMLKTIRRLTLASRIIPVYAGSSLKNKGVQPIINGVNSFLPSPLDRLTVTAKVYAKELNKIIDLNTEKETIL